MAVHILVQVKTLQSYIFSMRIIIWKKRFTSGIWMMLEVLYVYVLVKLFGLGCCSGHVLSLQPSKSSVNEVMHLPVFATL